MQRSQLTLQQGAGVSARSADGALRGERMATILVRLREHGEVHATDLAAEFGVSQATLRRDLAILEEQGLCTRRYGGAVPVPPAAMTSGPLRRVSRGNPRP